MALHDSRAAMFGDVDLDRGDVRGLDGVVKCIGIVGEGARIDHDPVAASDRLVEAVDDRSLVVRLEHAHLAAEFGAPLPTHLLEFAECGRPIHLGATRSEEVEVRSVDDEHTHDGRLSGRVVIRGQAGGETHTRIIEGSRLRLESPRSERADQRCHNPFHVDPRDSVVDGTGCLGSPFVVQKAVRRGAMGGSPTPDRSRR